MTDPAQVGPPADVRVLDLTGEKGVYTRGPAPLLGKHTEDVLRDLLGLSDDEIAGLIIEEAG